MKKKRILSFLFIFLVTLSSFLTVGAVSININFETTSKSITLINLDTDTIVYEKNPNQKRGPASVTKIMTYIVAVENVSDLKGTMVQVKDETLDLLLGTGSSLSGIKKGDVLSVYELLHCLMIPSGNDAALILADYVGNGDISKFVDLMNQKALELGCNDTHYANPHGLVDKNHYTTANDIAKMTKYAMSLPYFSEITNKVVSTILGDDRPLVTTNSLIDKVRGGDYYYRYAIGIKTGHVDESTGYCLVSTATNSGYTYLCVALGAPSEDSSGNEIERNGAMIDSKNLLSWALRSLELKKVLDYNTPVGEVKVKYAWKKDTIMLVPQKSLMALLPENVSSTSVEVVTDVPESVNAPIKAGEKIGIATLKYANQEIETFDLVASEDVSINYFVFFMSIIHTIITSKWVILAVIIALILLGLYIMILSKYNKDRRKSKSKARSKYKRKY